MIGGVVLDADRCTAGLTYYFGKQDFWTQQAIGDLVGQGPGELFFQHVAAGQLSLSFSPTGGCGSAAAAGKFSASQELWAARVNASLALGSFVAEASSIIAGEENVLLARLRPSHDAVLTATLLTPNRYGLPAQAGAAADALTLTRQSNKWVHNGAVLSECSPLVLNVAAGRFFQMDSTGRLGALHNQTTGSAGPAMCMWLASDSDEPQPHQNRGQFVSMAPCGRPGTGWRFDNATGTIASTDHSGICVGYHTGSAPLPPLQTDGVRPLPCGSTDTDYSLVWSAGAGPNRTVSLQAKGAAPSFDPLTPASAPGPPVGALCLSIVRANLNISLGLAASLSDGSGVLPFAQQPSVHNDRLEGDCLWPSVAACTQTYSAAANFSLRAGREYTLRLAAATTRDDDVPAHSAAVLRAARLAHDAVPGEIEKRHAASWQRFWNGSAVSLGEKRQTLESFWYGAQYMLNCMARDGGTIAGLLGPFSSLDPVGWADGVTLDCELDLIFLLLPSQSQSRSGAKRHRQTTRRPTCTERRPRTTQRSCAPSFQRCSRQYRLGRHEHRSPPGRMEGMRVRAATGSRPRRWAAGVRTTIVARGTSTIGPALKASAASPG